MISEQDFFVAIEEGNLDRVKQAIREGFDVNAKNGAPLIVASREGQTAIFESLISAGADLKAYGAESLEEASKHRHEEIVKFLVEANVASVDELNQALMNLMRIGKQWEIPDDDYLSIRRFSIIEEPICYTGVNVDLIKQLLKLGDDASYNYIAQANILGVAVKYGPKSLVKLLIEEGASVEGESRSALAVAARRGEKEIVKLLLEAGAEPDASALFYSDSALVEAAKNGNHEIVEMLIASGADISINDGRCLDEACQAGHLDVVKVLLDNGFKEHILLVDGLKSASKAD